MFLTFCTDRQHFFSLHQTGSQNLQTLITDPGAYKHLAQPGRKQARKHVRDTRDFNNIETRAFNNFFPLQGKASEGNSRHSDRNIILFPSCSS